MQYDVIMRELTSIRNQALQREGKQIVKPTPVRVHQTRSITSLRQNELKHDNQAQDILNGIKMNSSLKRAIAKKRTELESLSDRTKSLMKGADAEVERILAEARKRANLMVAEAKNSKSKADALLQENETKQKDLEKLDAEIVQRESQSKLKQDLVDIATKDVNKKQEIVNEMLKIASEKKAQVVDIFTTAVVLLELSVEQMSQAQKLENDLSVEVSQTLSKAGRMIERTATLIKEIDVDKSLLNQKAIELQNREKLLVDRTQQFDRAQKELKQK